MKELSLKALNCRIFKTGEDLAIYVLENLKQESLQEGDVLAVTSKIVSLAEGRLVSKALVEDPNGPYGSKQALIESEADIFLGLLPHNCSLTLKHGLMMVSAGIDESNSPDGDYILYPKNPWASAATLLQKLKDELGLKKLGLILTDSHTIPLRRGVIGLSLAHAGFRGTKNCMGEKDLFGRELKFTHEDLADGLAAAAVLGMGEGAESRPLVRVRGAELEFLEGADDSPLVVKPEEDLYYPFFADALQKRSKS